jgi:hypothetical protein
MLNPEDVMSRSKFRAGLIAGMLSCVVLAFLLGRSTGFEPRWRRLKDGMTQSEVRQVLGAPSSIGTSGCIGAGDKEVLRWEYRRLVLGRSLYYWVDFDYIGVGGTPVVYRTEKYREDWKERDLPSWWPWPRAKVRG